LEREAEVNSIDEFTGQTLLSYAAEHGKTEVLQLLLEWHPEVDWKDKMGRTPLSYSAGNGHTEAVRLLLVRDAEVDSRDKKRETPLFKSIWREKLESSKTLLQSGADINAKDIYGQTLLVCLMLRSTWDFPWPPKIEVVKWILAQPNFDINCKRNDGTTALACAVYCGYKEVEELLREHGAVVSFY
jgi:ankyrin repeat protein